MSTLPVDGADTARLFGQELTTQLRRIGSASVAEMHDSGLRLFKIRATVEELEHAANLARRHGWLEPPAKPAGEWTLTERGASLPRPTTLATPQIAARLSSVAKPVRDQATDWLPIIALVAGGVAAAATDVKTVTAVRVIAIAVLVWSLGIQFAGELKIVRALQAWDRLDRTREEHAAVLDFYGFRRMWLNAGFLAAAVAAFGLGIFGQWPLFYAAVVLLLVLGAPVLRRSLRAQRAIRDGDGRETVGDVPDAV